MSKNSKQACWQTHMNEWSKSGLTQKAFCQEKGLSPATFGYWRKKLSSKRPPSNLIPVTVSTPLTVRIRLSWGAELEVPVSVLDAVLPILARSTQGFK